MAAQKNDGVREMAVRYTGPRRKANAGLITRPEAAASLARKFLPMDEGREAFGVILLDGRHQPTGFHVVSVGTVNQSIVHPRETFRAAVVDGSVAIILTHNHPSGDTQPSEEDRSVTSRLVRAGKVLGIEVLDHLVVTDDGYYSFKEHGEIQ